MSEMEELMHDAEEAKTMLASASRKRWKDLLTVELAKIDARVKYLESQTESSEAKSSSTPAHTRCYSTVIRNYSWDQSDKFLKLYLTLPGVQNLNKENVSCKFQTQELHFEALGLDGKNYGLKIFLAYPIVSDKSYFKIKTDMVVIFGAKSSPATWESVTAEEKRVLDAKKATKPDLGANKEDPSLGMMGLMKQMYDDGDDEMKRMLNKTWYETQTKKEAGMMGGGMPNMGDLDL